MSRSAFSEYINNGRKPTRKTAIELSKIYGDEVYAIAGIQKPDVDLQKIISSWKSLSRDKKEEIIGIIYSKE